MKLIAEAKSENGRFEGKLFSGKDVTGTRVLILETTTPVNGFLKLNLNNTKKNRAECEARLDAIRNATIYHGK